MRNAIVTAIVFAGLAACATTPGERALVVSTAPRVSEFTFDSAPPISAAAAFAPWAELAAATAAETPVLEDCLVDREQCANGHLLRYRRLIELSAALTPREQLKLVQEYFNSIEQKLQPNGQD
jgi:hypothetical protein